MLQNFLLDVCFFLGKLRFYSLWTQMLLDKSLNFSLPMAKFLTFIVWREGAFWNPVDRQLRPGERNDSCIEPSLPTTSTRSNFPVSPTAISASFRQAHSSRVLSSYLRGHLCCATKCVCSSSSTQVRICGRLSRPPQFIQATSSTNAFHPLSLFAPSLYPSNTPWI